MNSRVALGVQVPVVAYRLLDITFWRSLSVLHYFHRYVSQICISNRQYLYVPVTRYQKRGFLLGNIGKHEGMEIGYNFLTCVCAGHVLPVLGLCC